MGELDTDFTAEVMKCIVYLRKETVMGRSLDVVPEEMLKVFCTIDAGEREIAVLFNNAVNFLSHYRPG